MSERNLLDNDADFLNYVSSHSETPRALFSNMHIARFLELAEYPDWAENYAKNPQGFTAMHKEDITDLLNLAKENITQDGLQ